MRLHWLNTEEKSAKRIRAWDCISSKCLYNLSKRNSLASSTPLPVLYANCSGSSMGWTTERMNDLTIFSRVFITSNVRATGRRSLSCFGAEFFRTGIIVDIFQRKGTKCWSLEEALKIITELISIKFQSCTISMIRAQTLTSIHINPFQQPVHNFFLN